MESLILMQVLGFAEFSAFIYLSVVNPVVLAHLEILQKFLGQFTATAIQSIFVFVFFIGSLHAAEYVLELAKIWFCTVE